MNGEELATFDVNMRIRTFPTTEKVPAMHIDFYDEEFPDCLIMLTENKFYGNDSLKLELTEEDLKDINDFLKEKSEEDPNLTRWEYMCKDWNNYTPFDRIIFPDIQPDYSKTTEIIL